MIDLKSVVEKHPECLDSATKFKSYMMDLYPDDSNKARIRILADIVNCGIALEIKNGKTDSISISNFCNTMEKQYGYAEKLVKECIEQFRVAFENDKSDQITTIKKGNITYVCNIADFEIEEYGVLKEYKGNDRFIAIPNIVNTIGAWSIALKRIKGIYIPDSVIEIGDSAFSGCIGLEHITIPTSVKNIANGAFSFCEGITTATILSDNTSIAKNAFEYCKSLKTVYFCSEKQKNKYADYFGANVNLIVAQL